jgi:hypothetical protein
MNRNRNSRDFEEYLQGFVHALYAREEPSTFRATFPCATSPRRLGDWSRGYRFARLVRRA